MTSAVRLGCVAFVAFVVVETPVYADADSRPCRTTTMPDESKVILCKDGDGRWRQIDQPEAAAAAPEHRVAGLPSRAEVTYKGSWSTAIKVAPRINLRNLNLGSVLNSGLNVRTINRGGDFNILVTATGSTLTGYVWGQDFTKEQFFGTIQDSRCLMTGRNMGGADHIEGQCGPNGFTGTLTGLTADRHGYKATFETSAVRLVDLDRRDREQLAATKAAEARAAIAEAKLRNAPAAGTALTKKLAGYVQTDSRGWAVNHYDTGSLSNVKIVDGSVKGGAYVLRGEYTYNGGQSGWVIAKMSGANLQCIQFWDAMVGCRDLRKPEQGEATRSALAEALTGSPSRASNNDHDYELDRVLQQQEEQRRQENAAHDSN